MKTRDLKSLSETIASVVDPIDKERAQMLQEGFLNSLTEKARQIASKEMEDEDEDEEDEMEDKLGLDEVNMNINEKYPNIKKSDSAPHGSDPDLKRRREKDMRTIGHGKPTTSPYKVKKYKTKFDTNIYEEEQLDELTDALISRARNKAILRGPEKRGFVKKATKRLQSSGAMAPRPSTSTERDSQWNKAFNEETDLDEAVSAKRMRIIRKYVKGNKRVPEHLKDYMERSFKKKRFKDKQLSDGRGAVGALETRMRRKSAALRAKGVEPKGVAPGYLEEEWGGGFQSYQDAQREVQAGLRRDAAIERKTKIADIKAVLAGRMSKNAFTKKHRTKFSEHPLTKKIVAAREKAKARRLAESMQLDEAGYKKLMRMKAAAYKAGMKARGDSGTGEATKKYAKLMRRAADQETRQDAKMALRGQASQKAVERGGSIIGKRGVPTQQGMKLADERSRAIKRFKSAGSISRHMQTGSFDGKMDKEGVAQKRQRQQAQAKFNKQARSGDFGPVDYKARSAGMRAQLNYEKKYGRLKGK